MVLFLITLLVVSIAGMLLLVGAKHYELSTGNLILAGSRPALAKFSARMVFLFGTALPHYFRWQAKRLYSAVTSWVHKATARGVLMLEAWLEGVLHSVREKTASSRSPGEASAFLREVGEYKKKLADTKDNRIDQ